ncbi:MAG: ABC transporter permease [Gemmatimonadaceae bacterium]
MAFLRSWPTVVVRPPAPKWVDLAMLCLLVTIGYVVMHAGVGWGTPIASNVHVGTSPWNLPWYAALSTLRMAVAYVLSLAFSVAYARAAANSRVAERFLIPLLDILQSVPILSFMPGVVLGLAALFRGRVIGLELAAVLLIFTSQAWNLAFGFHQALHSIPTELSEASTVYRLGRWRRFTRLELPSGVISLVANSMMSWAGGWFFLMASEQFTLGKDSYRLPGLGSYLAAAAERGDVLALCLGLLMLVFVIVLLDQLLWRPLVAWSDRFKLEQAGGQAALSSRVLDALRDSELMAWIGDRVLRPMTRRLDRRLSPPPTPLGAPIVPEAPRRGSALGAALRTGAALVLLGAVAWGALASARALATLDAATWGRILLASAATLTRTTVALLIGAAWTIPLGVRIGLDPVWSRRLQPVVQIVASIPATALFPALLLALLALPGGLNIAAVALMLLGTQWYVLFNVIAGAMSIPSDLKEVAVTYRITGWRRWKTLILPAIFPYVVTGMITATGGAWNASIVAEYVTFGGTTRMTTGLGAVIASAANQGQFPILLAATFVMSAIVITINRLVWRRLYGLAESRYQLA